MFSVKINKGVVTGMKVTGDISEISGNAIILLHELYKIIEDSSSEAAKEFQHCIEESIKQKIVFCSDEDMHERIADSIKKKIGGDDE